MDVSQFESLDLDDFVSFLGGQAAVEGKARELKAFQRARAVRNPVDLVRLALMYGPGGQSLRGLAAAAATAGIADLSDPALLKRLVACADLLEALCQDALARQVRPEPASDAGAVRGAPASPRTLRLVDASRLEGPGDRCWRLHMAYDPVAARVSEAKITTLEKGETLRRFQPQPHDVVIADRGYAQPDGLKSIVEAGADVITRVTWNSLKLTDRAGRRLDWLALCRLAREQGALDIPVFVHKARGRFTPLELRLVMITKPPEAAARARDLAEHASRKDQRKRLDPRTRETADHVVLVTSLDARDFPAERVGMFYRVRWQIELAFKRLKSLLHIDKLPAKSDALARTWLHAHLLLALYLEHLEGLEDSFPP